jgi:hypothetical protein
VRLFTTPRFGATHPADPRGTAVPTYASLLHTYGPRVAGAAIKGED